MKAFKASLKFSIYLLSAFFLGIFQFVILSLRNFGLNSDHIITFIPRLFHTLTCAVFQIRIEILGKPIKNRQMLFMSNHVSYLDIAVLGSVIPASFVAKKEVASWAFFNILAYLHQTAYIERKSTAIKRETSALEEKLARGRSFIIFPEATSTDGRSVWPFKSSLFALAISKNISVQPITLQILDVDGRDPDNQAVRELYAWHVHMDDPLTSHFWNFARGKGARLRLTFHEPLESQQFSDRKELAKACHDRVSKGLAALPI